MKYGVESRKVVNKLSSFIDRDVVCREHFYIEFVGDQF